MTRTCGDGEMSPVIVDMVGPAPGGRGEEPLGELVASDQSDPLSPLPVPNQSSLCAASIFLPILPSLPPFLPHGFVQIFLSLTAAHSLSPLLPAVTLSFHPSLRLHPSAPFVSLLFFARMPWQKWVLTVPSPHIPVPPFLLFMFATVYSGSTRSF